MACIIINGFIVIEADKGRIFHCRITTFELNRAFITPILLGAQLEPRSTATAGSLFLAAKEVFAYFTVAQIRTKSSACCTVFIALTSDQDEGTYSPTCTFLDLRLKPE